MGCPSESHKDAFSCHPPGVREHTEEKPQHWKRRLAVGWDGVGWATALVGSGCPGRRTYGGPGLCDPHTMISFPIMGHNWRQQKGDEPTSWAHRTQCLGLISQKLQGKQSLTHVSVHIKSWGDLSYVSVTLTETSGPRQLIKESSWLVTDSWFQMIRIHGHHGREYSSRQARH